jgi:LSD1 subclass zinc finger protein
VAEPTSGAREGNPLARPDGASLARCVCCDSTAHYAARLFIGDALGDPRCVLAVCNAVLLDPMRQRHDRVNQERRSGKEKGLYQECSDVTMSTHLKRPRS